MRDKFSKFSVYLLPGVHAPTLITDHHNKRRQAYHRAALNASLSVLLLSRRWTL